jgi:hypothetical protein
MLKFSDEYVKGRRDEYFEDYVNADPLYRDVREKMWNDNDVDTLVKHAHVKLESLARGKGRNIMIDGYIANRMKLSAS